jgi:DNA-binding response OmpR family regulator
MGIIDFCCSKSLARRGAGKNSFAHLWGEGAYESRTLDMHIMSLRKKLGDKEGKILETVYGVGYRIAL